MSLQVDDRKGGGRSRSRSRDRRREDEDSARASSDRYKTYADARSEPSYAYPEDDLEDDRYSSRRYQPSSRRGDDEPPARKSASSGLPYPSGGGLDSMLPGGPALYKYDDHGTSYKSRSSPPRDSALRKTKGKTEDVLPGSFPEDDTRGKGSDEDRRRSSRYDDPRSSKVSFTDGKDYDEYRPKKSGHARQKTSDLREEDKLSFLPAKYGRPKHEERERDRDSDSSKFASDRDRDKSDKRRYKKERDESNLAYGKPPPNLLAAGEDDGTTYGSYFSASQLKDKLSGKLGRGDDSSSGRRRPVSPRSDDDDSDYDRRRTHRGSINADPRSSAPHVMTVEPRDSRDSRDKRDPRDPRDSRDFRDSRESRDPRDVRDHRDPRDSRDERDPRDPKESRDSRDFRDPRESREFRDPRESREFKDPRESREFRDPRESREFRDPRESREFRDPKESQGSRDKSDRSGENPDRTSLVVADPRRRESSRDRRGGTSARDRSPQPPTNRMSALTVDTGHSSNLSLSAAPPSPLLESYHGTYQQLSPMPSPLLLAAADPRDEPHVMEALSPLSSDGEGGKKRNRRARFHDPEDIASRIAKALSGDKPPQTEPLIEILPSLTHEQVMELRTEYKRLVKTGPERKGVNVAKHIRARLKDEDSKLMKACYAVALGQWEGEAYWANFWYQKDKTRRELLIESLMGRTNDEIRYIKDAFTDKKYDNSLTKCMKTELKEDKFKKAVLKVLEEKRMDEVDEYGRKLPIDYELVDQDAKELHKSVKAEKGGESHMISIILQRSDSHLREVLKEYERHYHGNFAKDALGKSGNLVGEILAHVLNGIINRPVRDARLLHHALTASRKDELRRELLTSRLVRFHWDAMHMSAIRAEYRQRYGKDLSEAVKEATSGEWGAFCSELCIARVPNEVRRLEASKHR